MKLKKIFLPAVAVCMTFGITMLSTACDPKEQPPEPPAQVTYTVKIDVDDYAPLSGLNVLFYSAENSKTTTIKDKSASVELPEGNYVAYLTGVLGGYIYTPVPLNKTQTTGTIEVEAVEENELGMVAYQVLYLLEPDKILEGDPDHHIGQMCSTTCYTVCFDEYHMISLDINGDPLMLEKTAYEIHAPSKSLIPDGYTFDDTKYQSPSNGGFISVTLDKA